jgi:hypothetical protein
MAHDAGPWVIVTAVAAHKEGAGRPSCDDGSVVPDVCRARRHRESPD